MQKAGKKLGFLSLPQNYPQGFPVIRPENLWISL